MSENNPFNSYLEKKFSQDWDFKLKFSSPRFPHSNNVMAERAAGLVKNIFSKVQDVNIGLIHSLPLMYKLGIMQLWIQLKSIFFLESAGCKYKFDIFTATGYDVVMRSKNKRLENSTMPDINNKNQQKMSNTIVT